jgi:hypothetical protein
MLIITRNDTLLSICTFGCETVLEGNDPTCIGSAGCCCSSSVLVSDTDEHLEDVVEFVVDALS